MRQTERDKEQRTAKTEQWTHLIRQLALIVLSLR